MEQEGADAAQDLVEVATGLRKEGEGDLDELPKSVWLAGISHALLEYSVFAVSRSGIFPCDFVDARGRRKNGQGGAGERRRIHSRGF